MDSQMSQVTQSIQRAQKLSEWGRHREAIHLLQGALREEPENARLLCKLAALYGEIQAWEEMRKYAVQATYLRPEWALPQQLHSIALRSIHPKKALPIAEKAVQAEPDNPAVWLTLSLAQSTLGRVDAARVSAERLRELAPEWAPSHAILAEIRLQQGIWGDAETHARQALALEPEDGRTHQLLGICLRKQRRWREAATAFSMARNLRPEDHQIRAELVHALDRAWAESDTVAFVTKRNWDSIWVRVSRFGEYLPFVIGAVLIGFLILVGTVGGRSGGDVAGIILFTAIAVGFVLNWRYEVSRRQQGWKLLPRDLRQVYVAYRLRRWRRIAPAWYAQRIGSAGRGQE